MATELFFTREPVINRHRKLIAHRFTLHGAAAEVAATLTALEECWPEGERSVFVNLPGLNDPADVAHLAQWNAPPNATLEVSANLLAQTAVQEALRAALAGCRLCLDFSLEEGATALNAVANTSLTPQFLGFDGSALSAQILT
ncbi:MAG: hypothetical protein LBQ25_02035, partial [Azonexus sp.]|nr:hypothetical protein [Azonexus sp.]